MKQILKILYTNRESFSVIIVNNRAVEVWYLIQIELKWEQLQTSRLVTEKSNNKTIYLKYKYPHNRL